MDRHKIAACLAAAILQAGICERTRDVPSDRQSVEVRLANEILAFICSLHVLYSYLSHENGYRLDDVAQLDSKVLEKIGQEGFLMPSTYEGAESYEMHLIKAMRISKGMRPDEKIPPMDILLYSAILYHIELHNFEKPLLPQVL
ncbi:hypothetical protein SIID45300_00416 [Candidatus Magnetaquicoccaceae bacterium FCR-1]|uniref:Uncharacterized protein n=2 Tax=Candidatus Magnetaquiglobus chichijimensis TaxID=3141448 RepID=A0ABQ0C5F6_9PROT